MKGGAGCHVLLHQGQPFIGDPWAGHAAAAAGAAGWALLCASSLGTCPPCPQIPGICIPAVPSASCLPPSATRGFLSILLQTIDSWVLWFLLLQSLVQYPQPAGDGLDEVTCLRTEAHVKLQERERIWVEQELERLMLKPSGASWGDLLWSALQHWQVWVFAGLLLFLLALWLMWRKRSHQAQSSDQEENEEEDEVWEYDLGWFLEECIQWSVQDLQTGCERTAALTDNFTAVLRHVLRRTYLPGHTFHLEHDTEEQRPGSKFHVHVELEYCCPRRQPGASLLCFLHHREVVRRRTQHFNLLDTLCTSSYLDVRKTAHWFCAPVRSTWRCLPWSHSLPLVLLPSKHSCKLRLTNEEGSSRVNVLFGVQQGTPDIFVSSQPQGAQTPSTMWPETYAVTEINFCRYMARQAPQDSSHLKCLQPLAGVLACKDFSIYSIKTIVMYLLSTVPVSQWHRRHFVLQLADLLEQLCLSLEEKPLENFTVGSQRLPDISLPPDVRTAEPPNFFHLLALDPAARSQAMEASLNPRHGLAGVPAYGRC
ncbi:inositol 1,4,5-trisphosphate receptor-interacting protein-like 1 [Anomalospiza imberbis]|uniref:inositol 1,4,5-trisphosphate receptor-interacting protein-like 1 n=1 Tax=Anomalospiza imberbis TaxID=187417 RepID=UPI0035900699